MNIVSEGFSMLGPSVYLMIQVQEFPAMSLMSYHRETAIEALSKRDDLGIS